MVLKCLDILPYLGGSMDFKITFSQEDWNKFIHKFPYYQEEMITKFGKRDLGGNKIFQGRWELMKSCDWWDDLIPHLTISLISLGEIDFTYEDF